jgi:molybdopterin-guanine dinucleotide biosynthesis protein A
MTSSGAGIILAGGRSSRMGADKALLEIDGETMLMRTSRVVSAVVSEVLIVGRTTLPPELDGTSAIPDGYGEAGPLGGIATGLAHLGVEQALVVACDQPYVQADLLRLLVSLAPGYDAVVPLVSDRVEVARSSGEDMNHAGGKAAIERGEGRQARGPAPTHGRMDWNRDVVEGTWVQSKRGPSDETVSVSLRSHPTCAVYGQSCLPVMLSRLAQGKYRLRELLEALHVRWVNDEEIGQVDPEGRSFLNANTPDEWREMTRRG